MTETRLTASLPRLDVDIVRREDPVAGTETVTIRMQASPSFARVGEALAGPWLLPALFLSAGPWGLGPWSLWANMINSAWQPWQPFLAAAGGQPRAVSTETAEERRLSPPAGAGGSAQS